MTIEEVAAELDRRADEANERHRSYLDNISRRIASTETRAYREAAKLMRAACRPAEMAREALARIARSCPDRATREIADAALAAVTTREGDAHVAD